MPRSIEETAANYQPGIPKAPAIAESLQQDEKERHGDFEKRFPSVTADMLQERATFNRREHMAQQRATGTVTVITERLDNRAASQAPAMRKYPCGCTAWTNEDFRTLDDLPADCPTHSISKEQV